ncbi:olfactory receptor 5V1-like [Rhinatrema bivittatum]|uniref:olfactory receptor 5V1-like n=1 Tax=Rhinatrema bivittatum TaxID=194408 RepID=UPI0011275EBE|nr:olfactory receptor 5V1-like [Rhinatrema bivittatum]
MYFFLGNLSFLDLCITSVTLSALRDNLFTGNTLISFSVCIVHVYFLLSFLGTEFFLLTAMGFDRYVAICDPLRYDLIMNRAVCVLLASASWTSAFVFTVPQTVLTSQFSFCGHKEIDHYFCDLTALMKLSCSSRHNIEIVIFTEGVFLAVIPFVLTLVSYVCIISSILKIRSVKGRRKAFSTCSSHLTVLILFYGTLICVYLRPASTYSPGQGKLFSLLYTAVIPMLNPIIYSLRNQEVKNALKKIIIRY